jgi:hypothetical protein
VGARHERGNGFLGKEEEELVWPKVSSKVVVFEF